MTVVTDHVKLRTDGEGSMVDVTPRVQECVSKSGISNGIVTVFCPGSTGALSTVEYEPGLMKDVPDALKRIAPDELYYAHHETWHDDNGRGHVKATLLGPDISIPFTDGALTLGTWQQICFIECDTRGRDRELVVQIIGE
ncbi:MAG: YjbQ family protein [Candidatus Altiarchaeales archaeon]|nr:YjbQ family protein [Candidatus Altiarchaeales archaeon]MBD3416220.1 YjbQ family protein [Candidatus Altiarchaeales archaeon]